jgi:hypothetical protein
VKVSDQDKRKHKVGDMVVVNHSTDFLQAMSRKDTGIILEIREVKSYNSTEVLIAWADGDIRWMLDPNILKVISHAS